MIKFLTFKQKLEADFFYHKVNIFPVFKDFSDEVSYDVNKYIYQTINIVLWNVLCFGGLYNSVKQYFVNYQRVMLKKKKMGGKSPFKMQDLPMDINITRYGSFTDMVHIPHCNQIVRFTFCEVLPFPITYLCEVNVIHINTS